MKFMKRLLVLLVAFALLGCSQSVGKPELKKVVNEWGNVTEDYTEIITKVTIYNPNPFPIPIKDVQTEVFLNGMKVGSGKSLQSEIKPKSDSVVIISTEIRNDYIPKWWVSHIKNGERSILDVKGYLVLDLKVTSFKFPLPEIHREFRTNFLKGISANGQIVTLGPYKVEIESVKAGWGRVDENVTEIIATLKIKNDNTLPLVLTKTHYSVRANGISIGDGYTNVSTIIPPKSESEVPIVISIKTERLKDWWVSHLRNGEKTKLEVSIRPYVKIGGRFYEFELTKMESIVETRLLG